MRKHVLLYGLLGGVLIAVLVIGFLGLVGISAAGVLFYMSTGSDVATASPTPVPARV